MPRRRYKSEEIFAKLRLVDVLVSQSQNMADAIRQIGVSEVTFYRWRQEFGGLKSDQVKQLKDLELADCGTQSKLRQQTFETANHRALSAARELGRRTSNCAYHGFPTPGCGHRASLDSLLLISISIESAKHSANLPFP